MKVFAGGIITETNTFSPMPTGMRDFHIVRAGAIPEDGISAVMDCWQQRTEERGWEFIFSLEAGAQPAGITTRATYESLRDEMFDALKAALPVDMVLLNLHGAMVADGYDDCETDMITRAREIAGPDAKIGVELDLHCDVTDDMIEHADIIVIYKEYPHVDIADRAEEVFSLTADAAEGKIKPTMALYDCRMIGMYLTPDEPMRSLVDSMIEMEGKDGLLSVSIAHCFPWSDVPTNSAYSLAITDNNAQQAAQIAESLGQKFYDLRHETEQIPYTIDEALDQAVAIEQYPVVVADRADNAGGGAPSDSTFVLKRMLERGITNAAIGMFWDPIAVQVAISGGVGANLELRLGGKMGTMSGDPLDLKVEVKSIVYDMIQEWPQQGEPLKIPCGDSVLLHCQGIDIVVNSQRVQVLGPMVFSNHGIDLLSKHILVVKSSQHFYAGYGPIASKVIYMAAPGSVAPRFKEIPFTRLDLNKYPWVENPFA